MAEYEAQLVAVEAKLAKEPDNEDLISLKADLLELIELSRDLQQDEASSSKSNKNPVRQQDNDRDSSPVSIVSQDKSQTNLVDKNNKRKLTEADLLAKKKEKNRKKKAKLREKIKEQLDIAESEKQSWQSFANKKGLKGVTKKSIFASPCSVTGKVGVGTNGIADAPSIAEAAAVTLTRRKH